MKLLKRIVISIASITALFTALMGFAHTKTGRPLLALMRPYMAKSAVCPLGFDHLATLEDRQKMRDRMAARRTSQPFAATRTALDFAIGKTTRSDAVAWAAEHHGSCRALKSAYESQCDGKFFGADSSTLWLEFDSKDHLISLRGIENYRSPESAVSFFSQLRGDIRKGVGSSVIEKGRARASDLRAALLSQASLASDFSNYAITARLTNMGSTFVVTHDFLGF